MEFENETERTPLFLSCQKRNEKIVIYLIENGVNINKEAIKVVYHSLSLYHYIYP